MASYEIATEEVGAHAKTLAANTVDTVTFATRGEVEIYSDGSAAIYFTVDGTTPTIAGNDCFEMPAVQAVRAVSRIAGREDTDLEIKLISEGTPTYSVSRLVD